MSHETEPAGGDDSRDSEVRNEPVESPPVDLGAQHGGIGAEGRTPYPSEMLYIVREANIVDELDEVLAASGVELKEERDG